LSRGTLARNHFGRKNKPVVIIRDDNTGAATER
jgi:hypothetical protein